MNAKKTLLPLLTLLVSLLPLLTQARNSREGNATSQFCLSRDTILGNLRAEYRLGDRLVSTTDYPVSKLAVRGKRFRDRFGRGRLYTYVYSSPTLPKLTQRIRAYRDFILEDITVESASEISVNYMAPLVSDRCPAFISSTKQRKLFVPYDNDAWIRYHSQRDIDSTFRSYEVTAIYNPQSRQGLVVGFIDHDKWKNAIQLGRHGRSLKAFSGVADKLTRDHKAHGSLRGRRISSATVMIGLFDDWRKGLETFADLNAKVAPPRPWKKAMPVGWNSWGALAFSVNHDNSTQVSRFIAENLQNKSFCNAEGLVYTGLDSGWNSFPVDQLRDFARQCESRHQVPCIYWTPFTDWGKNGEQEVAGSPGVKYKDIWLRANGKPQEQDGAYAIDPTHPAVRRMMEQTAKLFRDCGFRYVKMDFMTHGRMEADSWHDKRIQTGTEAYNLGMQLLDSIFSDMYINLSISPIFPAQYAQSRRIACDAWNKIKDTEYTLNALSWGWWIDRIYQYNDADHVVLKEAEEGENRARVTSSVITGIFINGDDLSDGGPKEVKRRARLYLTNPAINAIATGEAFRPVNGDSDRSESCFVRHESDGTVLLACFNYSDKPAEYSIDARRIGLKTVKGKEVVELWSHQKVDLSRPVTVPPRDVKVLRIR